eukprot:c15644_g1_i1.p1 GENE.c15644_g1_i1~~c15644_g1_i1.p1  ORF type:complete len:1145 (+),score=316.35 c15644_g1_i1:41-3436(+)
MAGHIMSMSDLAQGISVCINMANDMCYDTQPRSKGDTEVMLEKERLEHAATLQTLSNYTAYVTKLKELIPSGVSLPAMPQHEIAVNHKHQHPRVTRDGSHSSDDFGLHSPNPRAASQPVFSTPHLTTSSKSFAGTSGKPTLIPRHETLDEAAMLVRIKDVKFSRKQAQMEEDLDDTPKTKAQKRRSMMAGMLSHFQKSSSSQRSKPSHSPAGDEQQNFTRTLSPREDSTPSPNSTVLESKIQFQAATMKQLEEALRTISATRTDVQAESDRMKATLTLKLQEVTDERDRAIRTVHELQSRVKQLRQRAGGESPRDIVSEERQNELEDTYRSRLESEYEERLAEYRAQLKQYKQTQQADYTAKLEHSYQEQLQAYIRDLEVNYRHDVEEQWRVEVEAMYRERMDGIIEENAEYRKTVEHLLGVNQSSLRDLERLKTKLRAREEQIETLQSQLTRESEVQQAATRQLQDKVRRLSVQLDDAPPLSPRQTELMQLRLDKTELTEEVARLKLRLEQQEEAQQKVEQTWKTSIARIKTRTTDLLQELSVAKEQRADMANELDAAEETIHQLTNQRTELENQILLMTAQIDQQDKQIQFLHQQCESLQEVRLEHQARSTKAASIDSPSKDQQSQQVQQQMALAEMEARLEHTRLAMEAAQTEMHKAVCEAEAAKTRERETVETIKVVEQELNQMVNAKQLIEEQMIGLQETITEQQSAIQALEDRERRAQVDLRTMDKKISGLEGEVRSQQDTVHRLNGVIADLTDQLEHARAKSLEILNQSASDSKTAVSEMTARLEALSQQLTRKDHEANQMRSEIKDLSHQLSAAEAQHLQQVELFEAERAEMMAAAERDSVQFNSTLGDLRDKLKSATDQLRDAQERMVSHEKRVRATLTRIKQTPSSNDIVGDLDDAVKQLMAENAQLRRECEAESSASVAKTRTREQEIEELRSTVTRLRTDLASMSNRLSDTQDLLQQYQQHTPTTSTSSQGTPSSTSSARSTAIASSGAASPLPSTSATGTRPHSSSQSRFTIPQPFTSDASAPPPKLTLAPPKLNPAPRKSGEGGNFLGEIKTNKVFQRRIEAISEDESRKRRMKRLADIRAGAITTPRSRDSLKDQIRASSVFSQLADAANLLEDDN